jgi:hypothetical protein
MARRHRHREQTPFLTTWCPIQAYEVPEAVRRTAPESTQWLAANTHLLGHPEHLATGLFPVGLTQTLQEAVDAHLATMQVRAERGLEKLGGEQQRAREGRHTARGHGA